MKKIDKKRSEVLLPLRCSIGGFRAWKVSFCLIFMLVAMQIMAQHVELEWAKSIGGSGSDYGQDIAMDRAGNVYITGYFSGVSDFDPGVGVQNLTSSLNAAGTAPTIDIFLAKYDAKGNYLWAKSIGGVTDNDQAYAIAVDSLGNAYITGIFRGTVDFDAGAGQSPLTATDGLDIFIAKYDSSGNYQWAKGIGGADWDYGQDIALDPYGDVYVTGRFIDTVDFDAGPGIAKLNTTPRDNFNAFVVKYSSGGNYLWAFNIPITSTRGGTLGHSIATDRFGYLYIMGNLTGTADFDPGVAVVSLSQKGTSADLFLAKYTAAGKYVWAKSFDGTGNSLGTGRGIVADEKGTNIYLTAAFKGTMDFNPGTGVASHTSNGAPDDILIASYDSSGSYIWSKSIGGTGADAPWGICLNNSGSLFLTGSYRLNVDFNPGGGSPATLTSKGIGDIFVAQYDISGKYLWAGSMGGSAFEYGAGVVCDATGGIYVTGYYAGTADFDPGTATINLSSLAGGDDVFLLKLGNGCPSYSTLTQTACDSFPFNGITYTATGIYTDTFTSVFKCDSIVTLNLTVPKSTFNPVVTGAYCDSVTFNGIAYKTSGVYTQAYPKANGCDSNITYDITIKGPSNVSQLSETACGSFLFNNTEYTTSGTYLVTLTNENGCDSIVSLALVVHPIPEAKVIKSGNILTVNNAESYQWLNCDNNQIIAAATAQNYTVTATGNYAAIISTSGCVDTSDCIAVEIGTGIHQLENRNAVQFYPNPTDGKITLQMEQPLKNATIVIYNLWGKTMSKQVPEKGKQTELDLLTFAPGIYFVEIKEGQETVRLKVVKK